MNVAFSPSQGATTTMLNQVDIENAYIDLYREMRKYIWGFDVVTALANVEISSFRTCPNIDEVRTWFSELKYLTMQTAYEDEELSDALSNFEDVILQSDVTYAKLRQVDEVIK